MALRREALALAIFALLGLLALYHPIIHMETHTVGVADVRVTDYYFFHWNFWWLRHALTTPDLAVYTTNYVMAPQMSSLALHTLAAAWYPVWALAEPLVGTVAAMTLVFIVAYTLTGYLIFVFLRDAGVATSLALIGGVLFQLLPIMQNSVGWTNVNLLGWFWIPLLLLTWKQIARKPQRRWRALMWAVLLGVSV
ncbi:MAG: hypothetical protein GYB67_08000, partial [Chloroflexi bacterium]|nr:hypothetical protein [Chloroflexota bacterium]